MIYAHHHRSPSACSQRSCMGQAMSNFGIFEISSLKPKVNSKHLSLIRPCLIGLVGPTLLVGQAPPHQWGGHHLNRWAGLVLPVGQIPPSQLGRPCLTSCLGPPQWLGMHSSLVVWVLPCQLGVPCLIGWVGPTLPFG